MARFFADISKRYDKFFDKETYELKRGVQFNVDGGKTNWSLKTEQDNSGKTDSKLIAKHALDKEAFQLEISVIKNPKFTVTTKRLPVFNGKFSIQEPKLEVELTKQVEKVAYGLKGIHNWKDKGWEAEGSVSYQGFDKMTLGAKAVVEQPTKDKSPGIKDYNLKVEWQRNSDQTLVFHTENQLKILNVGGWATLRENYVGFAQVGLDRSKLNDLRWKVGLEKRLEHNATLSALVRHGGCYNVLYKGKINNFEGHLAYNYDHSKPSTADKHSFEYRLIFNY